MYRYTDFDRRFVRARAAQYRDQLERHQRGELSDDDFRPLRLQNGWYLQRHAPMLRVAVPYGELSSRQLRALARVAREHDLQDAGTPRERGGYGHFTTRQNLQFNWIPLARSADVMELLAEADLLALWRAAKDAGFATPNIGLLTDMIACPGGDFCGLANARSIPIAAAITERFQDLDELYDIGDIDLHMSGCMNSCGHHHSGHIGILGVDKDGAEWYQVSLGGADGSTLSGAAVAGKVIGPSFSADEVPDVVEAVIDTYRSRRAANERFIDTVRRVGLEPFKTAANAVRRETAEAA